MTLTCNVEQHAFVPSTPLPVPHLRFSSLSSSTRANTPRTRSSGTLFRTTRPFSPCKSYSVAPTARISNGLPAYRVALLTRRENGPATRTLVNPQKGDTRRKHQGDIRYKVRMAEEGELYTVADIRCDAFYGYPKDPYYYPVRRREIYMAMRDRIDSGNKCLVIVDTQPPSDWLSFANNGELVVGSLDVSLHKASSGRRCRFGSGRIDTEEGGRRIYLSSMAVRDDWQGRGLAQQLLAQVDDMAGLHGIKEVFLHVEWENAPAVHVYRKSGFVCVDDDNRVPRWLHFLAKREHTLMRKSLVE